MKALIIIGLIQLVGWISAYPRHKKWMLEQNEVTGEPMVKDGIWTNLNAISSIAISFMCWWFIWMWYFGTKWDNWRESESYDNSWFNRRSKI